VLVNRASGSGDYQTTTTIFGGEPPEPPVCGNNIVESGEGCDDGNTDPGDGCDESCQVESVVCPATPLVGCKDAGSSVLRIKDKAADGLGVDDKVIWKWLNGPATMQEEFADPLNTSDYRFCIYTGSTPTTVMESEAPASGTCGTKACWREFSTRGYRYTDKAASADGIFKILLKTGSAGKSKIVVSARGANLPSTTTLPLDSSADVIVQLRNAENGNCWEERFPPLSIVKNRLEQFKAKTQ
jgi:cysteine-rich repeat protein